MADSDSTIRAPQRKKKTFRFKQQSLDTLPPPSKRTYYYDDKMPQLGLTHLPPTKNHPDGKKTFFARATVDGKTKRITLDNGVYPGMPIELARTKARERIGEVAKGTNPILEKRADKAAKVVKGLTVEDAVTLFGKKKIRRLSSGEKLPLKPSTITSYRQSIKGLLGEDLYQSPLMSLTEDTITKRIHTGEKSGKTYTATGCRSLSAVWNWLARQRDYRDQLPPNPVKQYALFNEGLHVSAPKQTRIDREELSEWFDAVEVLPTEYADFFLWLIFTGTRFNEAKQLDWVDIDWRRMTYQLRDPKNRRDATLPLPSYVGNRLNKRKLDSGKVFPFEGDARYHRKVVCEAMGKHWTNHDLRRTFSGFAQAVCSYTSVKRLMNHAFTDITEIYIGHSADLGEEIDKVQREILRLSGRSSGKTTRLQVVR
jgi:integrase